MRGDFYVVAEGTNTYGASRSEFEATHKQVAPNRWIKRESVLAYQATERCKVQTMLGEQVESDVVAEVGDWIVRQPAGELIVVKSAEFSERYEPTS
jgi:dTDP-4-dehydrorhamnose reductase